MKKNNLWKGIAIAGIWLSIGISVWAVAFAAVYAPKIGGTWDTSDMVLLAFILTWVIKNRDEE